MSKIAIWHNNLYIYLLYENNYITEHHNPMRLLSLYTTFLIGTFLFQNTIAAQTSSASLVHFTEKSLSLSDDQYYNQGLAHDENGNIELAVGFYSLALRQNSNHAKAKFNRGLDLLELGRFSEAKQDLDDILSQNPTDGEAYEVRGLIHYEMGSFGDAVADFNDALKITKKPEIHLHRGLAFSQMKYYREAFLDFDASIEFDSENPHAYINKGDVYASLGQFWEAATMYDKAIELNPNDAFTYNNRGSVLSKLGKFKQAMADFDRAIEIKPLGQIFINRALCLLSQGEFQAAKQEGRIAMLLSPDNPDTYYCIGLAEMEAGELKEAVESFEIAIDINKSIPDYYLNRGKGYFFQGHYYKAIEDFYKVLELNPENLEADEMVQDAYKALDNQNVNWMKEHNLVTPHSNLDETIQQNAPILYQYHLNMPPTKEEEETDKGFKEDPFGNG